MNSDITLTKEEFKVLHNSLCELDRFSQFQEIEQIVAQIRDVALKSAYEQDTLTFDRKYNHYAHWRQHYQLTSHWSIYDVDDLTLSHPYADAQYVIYDNHWGQDPVVQPIEGRDWNSLYRAADAAIQASGDQHHCFIESFTVVADRPGHLRLSTGS